MALKNEIQRERIANINKYLEIWLPHIAAFFGKASTTQGWLLPMKGNIWKTPKLQDYLQARVGLLPTASL